MMVQSLQRLRSRRQVQLEPIPHKTGCLLAQFEFIFRKAVMENRVVRVVRELRLQTMRPRCEKHPLHFFFLNLARVEDS
jgi:hypothetical protein